MPRRAWSTTPQAGVSPLVRVLGTACCRSPAAPRLVPARRRGPLEPGEGLAGPTRAALRAHDAPSRDCRKGGGRER
jgi:hypothetical protein